MEEVARHLAARSIAVFYDGFEQVWLWGRDGVETFHEVFSEKAKHVVMFISAEYVKKPWTRVERKAALSRMIREEAGYVLPVRFDDTAVPGFPDTVQYLRAIKYTPAELAALIAERLGVAPFAGKASNVPPPRMTSPVGEVVFDYSNFNGRYIIGSGTAEFETEWTKASNRSIRIYNDPKIDKRRGPRSKCNLDPRGHKGWHARFHFPDTNTGNRANRRSAKQEWVLRRLCMCLRSRMIRGETLSTNCVSVLPFRPMGRTILRGFGTPLINDIGGRRSAELPGEG